MYDEGTAIAYFFSQIWRLFGVTSPFFGLTFGQLAFGLLIAEFGITHIASLFESAVDTTSPSYEQKALNERSLSRRHYQAYKWNNRWN